MTNLIERLRERVASPFERPAVDQALMSEAATALSEAKAENERVTRERDAFFDSLRRLICINSVLTALRSTAPLWLEHAERLIDERNAALNPKGGDNEA